MAETILNQIPLLDPSFIYYCQICRKSLRNSVRIIAKLNIQTNCCINLCPPCLGKHFQEYNIQYYYICRKMDQHLDQLANLTTEEALDCITTLQNQGIQQMCLKQTDPNLSKMFTSYQTLTQKIFHKENLGVDLSKKDSMISDNGLERQKPNPANRKHLKTLGYNWQRQEFGYQPEIIFGYLMGSLDENERNDEDQNQLRQNIFRYYDDQIKKVNQVNDFLVNTMFLLGRKGLFESEDIPSEITELKILQTGIKNLITQICQTTNQDQNNQNNRKKENGNNQHKKHKKHKLHRQQRSTSELREAVQVDDRSRTREKKKKKKLQENYISENEIQKKDNLKECVSSFVQNKTKTPSKPDEISICSSNDSKRKRGRPAGSKNRLKVQSDSDSSKLVLKMNFDNKKVRLEKKKEDKRKEFLSQSTSQNVRAQNKSKNLSQNQQFSEKIKNNDAPCHQIEPKQAVLERKREIEINSSGQ